MKDKDAKLAASYTALLAQRQEVKLRLVAAHREMEEAWARALDLDEQIDRLTPEMMKLGQEPPKRPRRSGRA